MSSVYSSSSTPTTFENNNIIKMKSEKMSDNKSYQAIKQSESVSTIQKVSSTSKKKSSGIHLNNLWSIWYGIFGTALQAYAAIKCLKRILGYSLLPWPEGLPYSELNCSLGLNGAALLLLPIFLVVSLLKIGNLANDGIKLGRQLSTCSKESPEILKSGGCGLFRYGGPTAPFIHIAISLCLLIPKLLMEAKLIEGGFLSQEWIWHTDLDFIVRHKDRLVVLSFMPSNTTKEAILKPSSLAFTSASSTAVTHSVLKTLKEYIGHENHTNLYDTHSPGENGWASSISLEYMNLALALVIYSVRYPAIFWSTNKSLGIIFSFQLLINGVHTLLSFAGMSILYKVHIAGVWKSLPLLKHNTRSIYAFGSDTPFLLNSQVTFALYILSTLLVLASSIVLYFYGHTRFLAFLNQERERKVIMLKGQNSNIWSYFTHCAALCILISIGICNAPLLHDYTVIYKGSLDDITLICIISGILHLFFWIVIWLFLTIKQKWLFKLRITIGRATVREARSLKLVTDVDLSAHKSEDLSQQPLLVVGNGRTYSVMDNSPKKAIMGVIQKTILNKQSKSNGSIVANNDENDEEQIYWLRPALVPSINSPDSSKYFCWFKKRPKHKVTFNETTTTSINRAKGNISRRSVHGINEDDGDYATLRELPLPHSISQRLSNGDDTASEEGKLLACVHDEDVTYASNNHDFVPPVVYEDPSPLLEPAVIVHSFDTELITSGEPPRCLRRTDSGIIPHEDLPARSDSVSTQSSNSPPDLPGSNHSETSSGIHSNESAADHTKNSVNHNWKENDSNTMSEVLVEAQPVVIRRKSIRPTTSDVKTASIINEDPYGRATNMRMTSFTDCTGADLSAIQSSSATLPHYPTQPQVAAVYPNCSTMPLPQHTTHLQPTLTNGNSCNVYPRQHSTIPTHHNGVKLLANSYVKRLQPLQTEVIKFNNEPIYTKINRASGELYHYTS